MPRTRSDLEAVLRLLDEPDAKRAESVVSRLAQWELGDIEKLREASIGSGGAAKRNVDALFARARFGALNACWQELATRRPIDLQSALLCIAKTALPGADDAQTTGALNELANRVGARLCGDRAFDMGLDALCSVLRERGLAGNAADFYNPLNSYLPSVLDRGLGIPISLGSIAILVGQRLQLPVYGVGTPGHFLCFYGEPAIPSGAFFDPFSGFVRISRVEVERRIREAGAVPQPWMFSPVNEREIVARTLRNLIAIFRTTGAAENADRLLGWLEVLINHGQTRP